MSPHHVFTISTTTKFVKACHLQKFEIGSQFPRRVGVRARARAQIEWPAGQHYIRCLKRVARFWKKAVHLYVYIHLHVRLCTHTCKYVGTYTCRCHVGVCSVGVCYIFIYYTYILPPLPHVFPLTGETH